MDKNKSKQRWRTLALILLVWSAVATAGALDNNRPAALPDTITVYLTKTVVESVFVHTTQTDTIIIKGSSWAYIPGTKIPLFPKGSDE